MTTHEGGEHGARRGTRRQRGVPSWPGNLALILAVVMALPCTALPALAHDVTFLPRPSAREAATGQIHVGMRNVVLYPYGDAPAFVVRLDGTLAPTVANRPVVFDDIASYGVMVEHAELRMSAASMTVLMNRYVLPNANGPIKHVDISFGAGTIEMTGTMVKSAVRIRFRATATPSRTTDGDIRLRIVKLTAGGVIPKGVLDALGLTMEKLAQPRNTAVFRIVNDDMIIPLVSMFPPPKVGGMLRSIKVTPRQLSAVVGSVSPQPSPSFAASSFIRYRGGVVTFAKLTMHDVDLIVVPMVANATLGFSPADYYRQLEAGFTVPLPSRGLLARVPDYPSVIGTKR
jgi:hypothetical protein